MPGSDTRTIARDILDLLVLQYRRSWANKSKKYPNAFLVFSSLVKRYNSTNSPTGTTNLNPWILRGFNEFYTRRFRDSDGSSQQPWLEFWNRTPIAPPGEVQVGTRKKLSLVESGRIWRILWLGGGTFSHQLEVGDNITSLLYKSFIGGCYNNPAWRFIFGHVIGVSSLHLGRSVRGPTLELFLWNQSTTETVVLLSD